MLLHLTSKLYRNICIIMVNTHKALVGAIALRMGENRYSVGQSTKCKYATGTSNIIEMELVN